MEIRNMNIDDYDSAYALWLSCSGMGLNNLDDSREGIGKQMAETALNALKAQGINKVSLVVFAYNEKGNAFWEKMGFIERSDLIYRNRPLVNMVRIDRTF